MGTPRLYHPHQLYKASRENWQEESTHCGCITVHSQWKDRVDSGKSTRERNRLRLYYFGRQPLRYPILPSVIVTRLCRGREYYNKTNHHFMVLFHWRGIINFCKSDLSVSYKVSFKWPSVSWKLDFPRHRHFTLRMIYVFPLHKFLVVNVLFPCHSKILDQVLLLSDSLWYFPELHLRHPHTPTGR